MRRLVPQRILVASGGACVALALALVALGGPVRADEDPGSGFTTFALQAVAPGLQVTQDSPSASTHPQGEGELPYSVASLQPGPQGSALSALAWPGPLAANAGSTALLLGAPIPPDQAGTFNEPVRAEARTGQEPSTVTNTSYPGVSMTATAVGDQVSANASVAGSGSPASGFDVGSVETDTAVHLTGAATADATASSRLEKVSLAGGVIKIGSVVSAATASTDGVAAKASGATSLNDVTIAGQPVTIDQDGMHVGTAKNPANYVATQLVNQAMKDAGIVIGVSAPSGTPAGGKVTYNAGTVVFYWNIPQSQGQSFTATVGGAAVTVDATPGDPGTILPPETPTTLDPGIVPGGGGTSTGGGFTGGSAGGDLGSAPSAGGGTGTASPGASGSPSTGSGPSSTGGSTTDFSGSPIGVSLPGGLNPFVIVLFVLGSGLIAGGLRRLPDRVLEGEASACFLEGSESS